MAAARDRRKLTKRAIDAARWKGETRVDRHGKAQRNPCFIWDTEVPGLGLRIMPSGTKTFVVFYRTQAGRKRLSKIDRYPRITLKQARDLAREQLGKVAGGSDPVRERRERRKREKTEKTFAELCDIYMRDHGSMKKSSRDDARRIERHLKPAFGSLKAVDVQRKDVADLHRRIGKDAPYEANRVLSLLSVIFNKAEKWDIVPEGRANPAALGRGSRFKEKTRDRVVTHDEREPLRRAINNCKDKQARDIFMLAWLMGRRYGEIMGLRWGDYDRQGRTVRFRDTKVGEDQVVPVGSDAASILDRIRESRRDEAVAQLQAPKDAPVFPQKRNPTKPRACVKKAWQGVRDESGCDDLCPRDFRGTFATDAGSKGIPPAAAKELGGWKTSKTFMDHYARGVPADMVEAAEAYGRDIGGLSSDD